MKSNRPLAVGPLGDPSQPLTADDYLEQAESWLLERAYHVSPENHETLKTVCRFYDLLPTRVPGLDVSLHTQHRLREAVNRIVVAESQGRHIGLRKAVETTLSAPRPSR